MNASGAGMKISYREFKTGRRLMGEISRGEDVIRSVERFCEAASVETACFTLGGAVSSFTIGVYDQTQQVYVTHSLAAAREIVSCTGNISIQGGKPVAHARIVLADESGGVTGGRLFSETLVFAAELEMTELLGPPLERDYDPDTGMMLWPPPPP
jgi:uncharacterized protein